MTAKISDQFLQYSCLFTALHKSNNPCTFVHDMVDLKNKDSTRDLFSYKKYTFLGIPVLRRERRHIVHAQSSSQPPQYNIQD